MKTLVIGGTGPTGPFIIEGLLKRGYDVSIFHRGTHEIDLPAEVEHIHGDPHFAETIEEGLQDRSFDLVIAMYGRLRYVAEAMKGRTSRFIAVGGLFVYKGCVNPDHNPEGLLMPIPEDAPLQTDPELHRASNLMVLSEQTVLESHRQGHYSATLFRYPTVYGPRQLIPREWSIIRRILDGRKQVILPDSGQTLQSRGYAENMAHAVLLAVDQPDKSAGQVYNAGDEKVLTVKQWVELITRIMNYDWELAEMPALLARPSLPYVPRIHHVVYDLTKIKTELGYQDIVPVEEAMRRTVEWYLEHKPELGGEEELRMQDSFNYKGEDQLIQAYKEGIKHVIQLQDSLFLEEYHHAYPHPREARRHRDEVGR